MEKNKKKGILIISCLLSILLSIFLYPRKDDNKSIIKKSYAFKIKNNGETSYTSVDTIPNDLTNYHIDEEKTICENGGKVSIVGNKLAYQTLGSDRCSVYLYYEEELHDIKINVANPSYLLGGYTKSITNCSGTNGAVWDNKLNGIIISNWSDLVKCDLSLTPKTPSTSELLSTIVTNNAQNKNDTTIAPTTYGYRYQGADPDNYVWYNDELWRIIGYVPVSVNSSTETGEYRVKIIRNDSIGALVRETNTDITTVWEDKSLYTLLNTCYLGKKTSCTSACYSFYNSSNNPVTQCNYSVNGINESEYYGNMVENVYWGIGSSEISTATTMYGTENSTKTSKQAKIGLMSASDWGLAISGYTGSLSYSNAQGYTKDNYLFTNGYEWTMTSSSSKPVNVSGSGGLGTNGSYFGFAARPVLYLKSNVYVTGGMGSKTDPYTLGI